MNTQRMLDAARYLRIAAKAESMGITHEAERYRMKAERLIYEQRLEDEALFGALS